MRRVRPAACRVGGEVECCVSAFIAGLASTTGQVIGRRKRGDCGIAMVSVSDKIGRP